MKKYVAFLDILGFESKLANRPQEEYESFVTKFSQTLYNQWEDNDCHINDLLNGLIISDSIIIHTTNTSVKALRVLLNLIISTCKALLINNNILLRGAITKGDFEDIPAISFKNLQKKLIAGEAYVEAIRLEKDIKISSIVISNAVKLDINQHLDGNDYDILEYGTKNKRFLLKWADIEYLYEGDTLRRFVLEAKKADWIPHFFNTLYLSCNRQVAVK